LGTDKGAVVIPMKRGILFHHYHRDVANRGKKRSPFAANHMAAKEFPYHRLAREDLAVKKNFFDLTKLIRSIQRGEGNPDCFGGAQGYCDRLDCAWRQYCLEKPQDETTAYENEESEVHENETDAKNHLLR
jgi:hypothetical protein